MQSITYETLTRTLYSLKNLNNSPLPVKIKFKNKTYDWGTFTFNTKHPTCVVATTGDQPCDVDTLLAKIRDYLFTPINTKSAKQKVVEWGDYIMFRVDGSEQLLYGNTIAFDMINKRLIIVLTNN